MLNRSGITTTTYNNVTQILANVDLQASVGCIVDDDLGTTIGNFKIAQAGTPIHVDFSNLQTPVVAPGEAVSESATADIGESTGITAATVTAATFGTKVENTSGTYVFEATVADSTTTWKLGEDTVTLSDYGIVATGTAADGDTITIAYTAPKEAVTANAVLLHDVDVTSGNANGTALYFGVVNINRLASEVQSKVTAGVNTIGAITFIKA